MAHDVASLTRRYKFSASHRLHCEQFSGAENVRVFGKCNNANGHGHNYVVFVTVRGRIRPDTGGVADVAALDGVVSERIVTRFDHQDINRDPAFAAQTTTGENLVRFIWDELVKAVPDGELEKVGLIETRDNYFEYRGPGIR
jgi:6-pyruvoyltetrahydropterin/6-carboxytetrahydropterin synthase